MYCGGSSGCQVTHCKAEPVDWNQSTIWGPYPTCKQVVIIFIARRQRLCMMSLYAVPVLMCNRPWKWESGNQGDITRTF